MYGPLQGKLRLYSARGVRSAGKALSSDWEVFTSILVKDLGTKLGKGVDLSNHEVKSAENGGNYEYQYHKITGKEKLRLDMQKGHLFFDHSNHLRHVDLRYASGEQLSAFFEAWLSKFPNPYRQRYRKSVPFSWVRENGTLLMKLRDAKSNIPSFGLQAPRRLNPPSTIISHLASSSHSTGVVTVTTQRLPKLPVLASISHKSCIPKVMQAFCLINKLQLFHCPYSWALLLSRSTGSRLETPVLAGSSRHQRTIRGRAIHSIFCDVRPHFGV